VFYYTERDVRCKMMGVGKIIDVAVKKTSHSIHLPKRSHQTKSQEFPEHFHSFTHIIFQFKFRLWLCDLLNRSIDSDIKVLNREGDRLNYHTLPCDRLKCIWIFYYTYKRSGYKNILDSTTQNNNKINTSSLITRRGILYKSISCFIILHVNFLSSHWLRSVCHFSL
jgi:hypothetical protein